MSEAAIDCPVCGQEDAIQFYEGTENGAPHGAGYWPMQVSETNQDCDCDLSEAQMTELANKAWEPFARADAEMAEAMAAELSDQDYFEDYDLRAPTQPVYHAPGCLCKGTILCIP